MPAILQTGGPGL